MAKIRVFLKNIPDIPKIIRIIAPLLVIALTARDSDPTKIPITLTSFFRSTYHYYTLIHV